MVQIRPGEPRDLPEIGAIQEASPEAAAWPVSDYLRYEVLIASREKRVAGFLASRRVAEDECEILNLAVAPDCRRQGVARALVASFLEGYRGTVYLEVRASNTDAREFYKYIGFHELTIRPGYYLSPPESAIVMKFHSC
ncbi:MAG: GNAT family N-acetyltransferase [Bryobacteraceae bacterium]|jgi:ribosomal-protein-alanine N-acetyltransferase